MNGIDVQRMSYTGVQIGLGIGLIPVTITTLISCSKIILINIIADIVVRILTVNRYSVRIRGLSFVAVPLLWRLSMITGIIGGTIVAISLIAALTDSLYRRYVAVR